MTLENRDVPSAWYTVHLDSAPQGTLGDTAASIASGSLTIDSSYDPDNDGTALVYADSATDAIRLALTGGVVVNLTAVSLPPASYDFNEDTSSGSTGDQTAFAITPTAASSTWKVYLEDLTADPTVSDWDYNDFYWTVTATEVGAASIQHLSIAANAAEIVFQPNTSNTATFTVSRESDTLNVAVSVAYNVRLRGDVISSGTVTLASGQTTATITVLVPPPGIDDPASRPLVVELLESSVPSVMLTGDYRAATMVYAADAVPSVGVRLPEDYQTEADPDAAFTTSGNFVRGDASSAQPLTVRYQATVEEGEEGEDVVDLGTFTATFAAGEDHAAFTVAVPASATPSPDGRWVGVKVLPPLPNAPYPYTPEVDGDEKKVFVRAPIPEEFIPGGEDILEFRNASNQAVTKLTFSNWESGFKKDGETPVVDKNFIKTDPDRFTIFFKTTNADLMDKDTLLVTITSEAFKDAGEKSIQDPTATTGQEVINYELKPAKSGVRGEFESIRPLILVSNPADDARFNAYGIQDGNLNDATVFSKLGDKIGVKLKIDADNTVETTASVPAKKTVTLDVVSLRHPTSGETLYTEEQVKTAIRLVNQIYAPAGIQFSYTYKSSAPPTGVDLADGLGEVGTRTLTKEEYALLRDSKLRKKDPDTIGVFLVNFLANEQVSGYATPQKQFKDAPDNIVIGTTSQAGVRGALPHEIAHVLLNCNFDGTEGYDKYGHVTSTSQAFDYVNILATPARGEPGKLTEQLRLRKSQIEVMYERKDLLRDPK